MPIRNVPLWLDRYPKSRRPSYPRFRGELETDVVIVGGGLTGCVCAWSFAGAGVKTILLDADSIGRGGTAESAGLIREDFDASFRENVLAHGLRASRTMWQMIRRASLDFSAAIRRQGIRCDLASSDYLTITRAYSDGARLLQREHHSRREAGLEHSWLKPAAVNRAAAVESGGAIKTHGFTLDPYRACVGFAAAASTRGALLHEDSPVRRIRAGRKQVVVTTAAGTIRAAAVVVATSAALTDLRALRRHLKPFDSYAVVTEPLPIERPQGRRCSSAPASVAERRSRAVHRRRSTGGRRTRPLEGACPANGPVDVRAFRPVSANLRAPAGMGLGLHALRNRRSPAVYRPPSQLSPPFVCDGRSSARRGICVARSQNPPAPVSEGASQRGRFVRLLAGPVK
jgi:glycine/D-amino acid oxidase-like deaminating enzyme